MATDNFVPFSTSLPSWHRDFVDAFRVKFNTHKRHDAPKAKLMDIARLALGVLAEVTPEDINMMLRYFDLQINMGYPLFFLKPKSMPKRASSHPTPRIKWSVTATSKRNTILPPICVPTNGEKALDNLAPIMPIGMDWHGVHMILAKVSP